MFMFNDFILNGQGHGRVGEQLAQCRYEPGLMRPFFDSKNRRCVTVNTGRTFKDKKTGLYLPEKKNVPIASLMEQGIFSPVFNATSLRRDEWREIDRAVTEAAGLRLKAWSDLAAAARYGGFNGMAKTVLDSDMITESGEAIVDMDALTEGRTDSPQYESQGTPLPITHSDFWFSMRRLLVSRNSGMGLDTTMAKTAARRVAETVEKVLIGTQAGIRYGPSNGYIAAPQVYGYTNYPYRIVKTDLTTPNGLNSDDTVDDILDMRDLLFDAGYYGPFMLYHSTDWDRYFDDDYGVTAGSTFGFAPSQTLRERIKKIDDIQDVRRLDVLDSTSNPFTLLMIQMTEDVARAIEGMNITTIQWESMGGMRLNFKVMCILVGELRSNTNGDTGIVHATAA